MIVVIAPENDVPNEMELLNRLFQEGLQYYHFRKPHKNYREHCAYLDKINKKYHHRIVVHQFHELINEYPLKGIHFQEQKRKDYIDNPGQYFKTLNMFGKTISSSFHELKDLNDCKFEFDYHLLSPVFTSISKPAYQGRGFDVNHINKLIVGMGGVTKNNILEIFKLGFKGLGVLGCIWNTEDPVKRFIELKTIHDSIRI